MDARTFFFVGCLELFLFLGVLAGVLNRMFSPQYPVDSSR
jgi:hypothetical protein